MKEGLDTCGQTGYDFCFYQSCVNNFQKIKPPQYSLVNGINIYIYRRYPIVLHDFTLVEEAVIARAHPIITIIKLRPSGASVSASYSRIREYAMVLPQQLEPLLNLLSARYLHLHDIIQVVWLEKRPHNKVDLRYFGRIKKVKVLEALLWLKDNNTLYKYIVINFKLTDTWEREFVPAGILSKVLQYDENI